MEEVSSYLSVLNPLNLYKLGATFYLGRLFLTSERIILLPYDEATVKQAKRFEKVAYEVLAKAGLGIPAPQIRFFPQPLMLWHDEIQGINPFRKAAGVHPSLALYTPSEKYVFKFTAQDKPANWADAISQLGSGCVADVVLHQCMSCGMTAIPERTKACAACGSSPGPSAEDIYSGRWATELLGQLATVKGWRNKLRALASPSGHTSCCAQCEYLNHHQADYCKYCRSPL